MIKRIEFNHFKDSAFLEPWKSILERSGTYDIGQTHSWIQHWWEFYHNRGVAPMEWLLLADENQGACSAFWPFFIRRRYGMRIVHWIGQVDGMATDYSAAICPENYLAPTAKNLVEFLAVESALWDVVDLRIPPWALGLSGSLLKRLELFGKKFGLKWRLRIADYSVVLNLAPEFDSYLAALGKKTRIHLQQYLRSAEKNRLQLRLYRRREILDQLPVLFALNSRNWKIFNRDVSNEFFMQATAELIHHEEDVTLGVLTRDESPVGAFYCFSRHPVCYLHPAGVLRENIAGASPGLTMYALFIETLIKEGYRKFDFSPGLEEYKLRLGGEIEPVFQLLVWHGHSKIKRWRLFDLARHMKNRSRK